jgi:hypothetical protein
MALIPTASSSIRFLQRQMEVLRYCAANAGIYSSPYLSRRGRAIWQSAFGHFPNLNAMASALQADSLPFLDEINAMTERSATPWQKHRGFEDDISFAYAGKDFPKHYAA